MSDSGDKSKRVRRRLPVWTIVGATLLITISLVGLIAWKEGRRQHFTIQITPEIRLDLVAILTTKNPWFEATTWQKRVFDKLPAFVRNPISVYYKPPPSMKLGTRVSKQELLFCFLVKYPDEWNSNNVDVTQRTKITPAVSACGIKGARLHYKDGWYSERVPFADESMSWSNAGANIILYEVRARDVPTTVRDFNLELVGPIDASPTAIRTVNIINPLYDPVAPIARHDSLPTTVTVSGVDVTLTAFASQAAEIRHSSESRQFPWLEELQKTGRFFRAAGSPADPNWCNVVIDITENGRAAPWSVRTVQFFYGSDDREFTTSRSRSEDLSNNARHRDFIQFFPDVGMLQQPIKLEVSLQHNDGFGEDELATFDLDLPTTGAVSRLVSQSGLWSGKCEVCASNGGDWEMRRKYKIDATGPMGALTIAARGKGNNYRIVGAELQGIDGRRVDVSERVTEESKSLQLATFGFQYDDRRISWKELDPIDLTDFSTMSLTVASPKTMGPVVFYAQPGVAEIPVGGE